MNLLFASMLVGVIVIAIMLVIFCRNFMKRRCCKPCVKIISSIERKLMFNSLLRAALETYLSLAIQMWYGWRIS